MLTSSSLPLVLVVMLGCGSAPPAAPTRAASPVTPAQAARRAPPPPPHTGGGSSCEQAANDYVRDFDPSDAGAPGERTTAGTYGAVLNQGAYFKHCALPDSSGLVICAAILDGRAVGVSVRTNPIDPAIEECVAKAVRDLEFPPNAKMDITRTLF